MQEIRLKKKKIIKPYEWLYSRLRFVKTETRHHCSFLHHCCHRNYYFCISCLNYTVFNKTKKKLRKQQRKAVKNFKEIVSMDEIQPSPDTVQAMLAAGLTEKDLKNVLWKFLNGLPGLNQKGWKRYAKIKPPNE